MTDFFTTPDNAAPNEATELEDPTLPVEIEPEADDEQPEPGETPAEPEAQAPKPVEIGKVDPEAALKGTLSVTFTFMPEDDDPLGRRVVATIRVDQALPASIKTFRESDLTGDDGQYLGRLPEIVQSLRAELEQVLLKQAAASRKPARTITIEKPKAKEASAEKPTGQLGLF